MAATMEKVSIIPAADVPSTAVTPMVMLAQAVERGADITVIEKMMGLSERWEANQARKAFNEAIAAAKAEIPAIIRNREGHYSVVSALYGVSWLREGTMVQHDQVQLRDDLRVAFTEAIRIVGIDAFKQMSWFGSNDPAFKSAKEEGARRARLWKR